MVIGLQRLNRSLPVRQQAADLMQDAIMKGLFRPGESLQQRLLVARFNLSHSAVREVLLELENRGLIAKKGSTYRVSHLSEEEFNDLTAMRNLLEPVACRLAAFNWRPELGVRLEECIEQIKKAYEEDNVIASWQYDREFHRIIWKHQPNRVLEAHLDRICTQLFAVYLSPGFATYYPKAPRARILGEHGLILSLLRTGDGERTERIVRRMLDRAGRRAATGLHHLWDRSKP